MENVTLKKFLFKKQMELYDEVDEIKTKLLNSTDFTETDIVKLNSKENELNLIKSIIKICAERGNRF